MTAEQSSRHTSAPTCSSSSRPDQPRAGGYLALCSSGCPPVQCLIRSTLAPSPPQACSFYKVQESQNIKSSYRILSFNSLHCGVPFPGSPWVRLTWLSILISVKVSFSLSASTRARIPAPVIKLDSMFRLFKVLFTFSISAKALLFKKEITIRASKDLFPE